MNLKKELHDLFDKSIKAIRHESWCLCLQSTSACPQTISCTCGAHQKEKLFRQFIDEEIEMVVKDYEKMKQTYYK